MFRISDPVHGVLDADQKVGERLLKLRARQIRMEKSGLVSALVALIVDTTPVYSDWVTVDKADDRHSFANALYGTRYTKGILSDDITTLLPQQTFETDMMLWSRALYPRFIGASSGSYEAGDENPSSPPWAVPGLVLRGLTSIWFGDAKAGKSTLQRLTATSLEHGINGVIPVREAEGAIWVNAEEDRAEHTRQLGNANAAVGLPRNAQLYTIHARGMQIQDLAQRLDRAVMETGAKHIFIDSLSRLAQGMSLNENQTATLLVDSIGGLDCSANWIGHTGQDNTHRLSGSKHFTNAARLMLRVQSRQSVYGASPELKRGVRASVTDANGAAPTEPMYWTFEYHRDYGLLKARLTDADEWPTLLCGAMVGETKQRECGRRTWDGVLRNGQIRCPRHRGEEDDV